MEGSKYVATLEQRLANERRLRLMDLRQQAGVHRGFLRALRTFASDAKDAVELGYPGHAEGLLEILLGEIDKEVRDGE